MRTPTRIAFAAAMLATWCAVVVAQAQPAAVRVVLISLDGLRPDAIDAAPAENLQALIADGSFHPEAQNDLPSATLPNHTTMVTGLTSEHHGVLRNTTLPGTVDAETIFDVASNAGLRTGVFVSKEKLLYLAPPDAVDVIVYQPEIEEMTDALAAAIAEQPFDLLFVHYREPDSTGHANGWMSKPYLDAVRRADAQVGRVLDALDAAGVLAETDIIVTADHGGMGIGHGLNIPENRTIPWIGKGPSFAAGRTLCDTVFQPDTAATVLDLLGLPISENLDGAPVVEAYATTDQAACEPVAPSIVAPCMVLPLIAVAGVLALLLMRPSRHRPGGPHLNRR